MLARALILLAVALAACGRDPMRLRAHDSARPGTAVPDDAHAAAAPSPDLALPSDPGSTRDSAAASPDGPSDQAKADACVPLTCHDPACVPAYCGEIGDGCGAALDCGECLPGWSCKDRQCLPVDCVPITCDTATPFPYCGTIGDGCGGTLHCACPTSMWTCVGHVCNAVASGCVPLPGCVTPWGDEFCGGMIGDGCGGVLDCRRECGQAGFVCQSYACVDTSDAGQPTVPPPPPRPPAPPVPPPPPPPPCPPPPPVPVLPP